MKLGLCTGLDNAAAAKAAGFDYVELGAQGLLQGTVSDDQWTGAEGLKDSPLPAPACNVLVPGTLKITGPEVNFEALTSYMANVTRRAGKVGVKTLVFGSGAARNVPEGFNRARAVEQIVAFLKMAGPLAHSSGVTIVIEPLNRGECNIINSVGEGMTYVKWVDHPGIQCLVDSYHMWLEGEQDVVIGQSIANLAHVHVADKEGRVAPGESKTQDYSSFFRTLKKGGYDGPISVECAKFDIPSAGPRVVDYIRKAWAGA